MRYPVSVKQQYEDNGVVSMLQEDLTPFEIDVIGAQDMEFQYFARATVSPGVGHYDYYRAMGVFYTIPGGDGTIDTCPLSQIKKKL